MPRTRRIPNLRIRIINNQRIRRREQRHRRVRLVLARVPGDFARLRDAHVVGDGVGCIVHAAGGDDVDSGGRDGEGGVVPGEGDLFADFVVGCCA